MSSKADEAESESSSSETEGSSSDFSDSDSDVIHIGYKNNQSNIKRRRKGQGQGKRKGQRQGSGNRTSRVKPGGIQRTQSEEVEESVGENKYATLENKVEGLKLNLILQNSEWKVTKYELQNEVDLGKMKLIKQEIENSGTLKIVRAFGNTSISDMDKYAYMQARLMRTQALETTLFTRI